MQWTLINWKRKDLPVVLSLKEVEFLFDTIAGVRHGKFKRLTRRLVRGLREREKHDFLNSSSGERGCHISEACSSITTISTRIFTYSMSTLVHVGPQSLLLIGRRTNTTQIIFHNTVPTSCFNTAHWSTQPSFRFTAEPLFTLRCYSAWLRCKSLTEFIRWINSH